MTYLELMAELKEDKCLFAIMESITTGEFYTISYYNRFGGICGCCDDENIGINPRIDKLVRVVDPLDME